MIEEDGMGARRIAHRMGWVRNPLRRTSDRIESWLTFLVVMAILLLAPWTGWYAARSVYQDGVRTAAWQREHRFAVTAVLLEDAAAADGTRSASSPRTPARWIGPDNAVHIGLIFAEAGARRGGTVPLWVDEHGAAVAPPERRNVTIDAALAALLTVGGIATGLAGLRRIVVWRLDRRRLRAWQDEWLVVGPRWSHR
jgi:hypothetical protein